MKMSSLKQKNQKKQKTKKMRSRIFQTILSLKKRRRKTTKKMKTSHMGFLQIITGQLLVFKIDLLVPQ